MTTPNEALLRWEDRTSGDPLGVAWRAVATAQVRTEFWRMIEDGLQDSLGEEEFRRLLRDRIRSDYHEHLVDAFMAAVDEVMEGRLA